MKLSRRLLINVVAFVLASAAIVAYGVVNLFGNPFEDPTQVTTELAASAGLRPNFSVSHNGIVVGVISDTRLTDDGVEIRVRLDEGARVPRAVEARVVRASPVGEQRLELEPTGEGDGELLADGDVIPAADDAVPPVVSEVVDEVVDLIDAIPPDALDTVIEETALALDGRAEDIQLFIAASTALNEQLLSNEEDFRRLLDAAPPALDALNAVGDELETSLENSAELAQVLATNRDDLVDLLGSGADLATVGQRVLETSAANIVCLADDLADLNTLLAQPENLTNIDRAFQLNFGFFGPINNLAPQGPAKDLGVGEPKPDQKWLRVSLILPPQQPAAVAYVPARPINPVRPGAACRTPLGPGADAPDQADPAPLYPGTEVQPPTDADARVNGQAAAATRAAIGPVDVDAAAHRGSSLAKVAPLLVAAVASGLLARRRLVAAIRATWSG